MTAENGDQGWDLREIVRKLRAFRDARDWSQFHEPKDLAAALAIEAGELQQLFLWKRPDEIEAIVTSAISALVLTGVEPLGDWSRVEFGVPVGADPREEVARALRDSAVDVRELTLRKPSLERYFQYVTESEVALV